MKVIVNLKLVKKYKWLARLCLAGTILTLAGGVVLAFSTIIPNAIVNFLVSTTLIVICYTLLRINGWLAPRWGTNPRLDETISDNLKGLGDDYSIFHYVMDVPHVLIGPTGIHLLEPLDNAGKIKFDRSKNTWSYTKRGGFFRKLFAADTFIKPDKENDFTLKSWTMFLQKLKKYDYFQDTDSLPKPTVIFLFTNPEVELETAGSRESMLKLSKYKEYIRGLPRLHKNELESIDDFLKTLPGGKE